MSTFHNAGEFIGANIEFFSIFSLIDFSDSDMGANATPYKGDGTKLDLTNIESKPYHQAQNLNILIQSIGFRCQPVMISVNSQLVTITSFNNAHSVNLGSVYTGTQTLWTVKFATENPGAWNIILLQNELYSMPIEGSASLTDSTTNIIGNIINTNVGDNVNRNTIIEMAEIL
mgnify:FL=1|jgi:hypothetical protein|tara:strand:+ start:3623 stop:4141 length:519 start_codon:yes stop_codon:yes gene_type:complete